MKKILIPSLSLGLLAKSILVSHALAFTLYVDDMVTHPNAADTTYETGVATSNAKFSNIFTPDPGDNGISAAYTTPSVVNFGLTSTFSNSAPGTANTGTFSAAGSTRTFAFDLQNGSHAGAADGDPDATQDAFDSFVVTGTLSGSVADDGAGSTASTTKVTFSQIKNQSATGSQQMFSTLKINPNNGLMAEFIEASIAGRTYDIYINQIQDIPAPGQQLTISGFITTPTSAVPEPGSMALLLGLGVSGTVLLRRRKK